MRSYRWRLRARHVPVVGATSTTGPPWCAWSSLRADYGGLAESCAKRVSGEGARRSRGPSVGTPPRRQRRMARRGGALLGLADRIRKERSASALRAPFSPWSYPAPCSPGSTPSIPPRKAPCSTSNDSTTMYESRGRWLWPSARGWAPPRSVLRRPAPGLARRSPRRSSRGLPRATCSHEDVDLGKDRTGYCLRPRSSPADPRAVAPLILLYERRPAHRRGALRLRGGASLWRPRRVLHRQGTKTPHCPGRPWRRFAADTPDPRHPLGIRARAQTDAPARRRRSRSPRVPVARSCS